MHPGLACPTPRYAIANCREKKGKLVHSRLIVDEGGTIVRREEDESEQFPECLIAGPRQITWVRGDEGGDR